MSDELKGFNYLVGPVSTDYSLQVIGVGGQDA